MSQIFSIERDKCQTFLPEWADALSTYVGRVPPPDLESSLPVGQQRFNGRIEFAPLKNSVFAKIAATPHFLGRSIRSPTPVTAAVIIGQLAGSCRVEQDNRSCILRSGDWSLFDPQQPFRFSSFENRSEYLVLAFKPISDIEELGLIDQAIAHRWHAKTGMSRILLATLTEAANQMNRLGFAGRTRLERTLSGMAWDAVREQLEGPPDDFSHCDLVCARIKKSIEQHLADPDLSVDSVARACGMSTRSIHRAFNSDPFGSVSQYIWIRRLTLCAEILGDSTQVHRSITDVCFSGGFNSTSHFSRLFKEHFGVSPREYRVKSEHSRGLDR